MRFALVGFPADGEGLSSGLGQIPVANVLVDARSENVVGSGMNDVDMARNVWLLSASAH